jgi:hypothetical protein
MKRAPLLRSTKRMKRTPLRKVSKKQSGRLRKYYPIQVEFLKKHKWCMICMALHGVKVRSSEVHHSRGRNGRLLYDTRFFVASCRGCRMVPHLNIKWAREVGITAEAKDWGVYPK